MQATDGKKRYLTYWLVSAIAGLILIGFGLSLFGEALIAKYEQRAWFWFGTLSLVIVNSGVALVGQSVIYRIKYLREKA
ncbi:MAG: hypothetical protein WBA23_08685 [Tunicatimonas sp.]|uniref:hypothetical protein n=1 Tax=Tunicatimonas sp. TaxID=1940096 RepID=UPI003C757CCD